MKKLTKLNLNKNLNDENLTSFELSQLIGGTYNGYYPYDKDDIINNNQTMFCECTYQNRTKAIINKNALSTCRCTCESM